MERLNIIERVFEPTEWVNSLVVVQKPNGKVRICLDPKDLNRAIKRHYHHIPNAEDILSRMAGATVFGKLDASSGYWQIQLDEESSKLLTFNSPYGRYKFKRLPDLEFSMPLRYFKPMLLRFWKVLKVCRMQKMILLCGAKQRQNTIVA